jgi:hypothetical protein
MPSVASEVVSACMGGMFSASALYPLEILKTRMQAEGDAGKFVLLQRERSSHSNQYMGILFIKLNSPSVVNNSFTNLTEPTFFSEEVLPNTQDGEGKENVSH